MRRFQHLIICLAAYFQAFPQMAAFYNVKDFGAKGDGQTIETKSIEAAINAASQAGGEQFSSRLGPI
jgi:hypothetical protein